MNKQFRSIQVLRAAAAISVVFFHARSGELTGFGAAGVDLFFVISGFIIAKISQNRSPLRFAIDRLWRIFPIYIIALVMFVTFVPIHRTACQDIASLTLLPIGCGSYLTPAWTLAFELTFYALAALTIGRPKLIFPLVAAVALFAPPIVEPVRSFGNLVMFEFLAGVLIANLPLNSRIGFPALILGAALLLEAPAGLSPSPWRVVVWGIPASLMVYGAVALEWRFAGRRWDWAVRLGDASYSIYLFHFIMHRAVPMWWPLSVFSQVAVGVVIFYIIERPVLNWRHRLRSAVQTNDRTADIIARG